jgi:hypothetical protein
MTPVPFPRKGPPDLAASIPTDGGRWVVATRHPADYTPQGSLPAEPFINRDVRLFQNALEEPLADITGVRIRKLHDEGSLHHELGMLALAAVWTCKAERPESLDQVRALRRFRKVTHSPPD